MITRKSIVNWLQETQEGLFGNGMERFQDYVETLEFHKGYIRIPYRTIKDREYRDVLGPFGLSEAPNFIDSKYNCLIQTTSLVMFKQ